MPVVGKGQVFCSGECGTWREEALDGGVFGAVDEHDSAIHGATRAELIAEKRRLAMGDADCGKHHREWRWGAGVRGGRNDPGLRSAILFSCAQHQCLRGDLSGQLVGRQTCAREDGQFLPARQRIEPVDGRQPGLDKLAGMGPHGWVDGQTVDVKPGVRHDRRSSVDGRSQAIQHAAKHRQRYAQPCHCAGEGCACPCQVEAIRPGKHLYDGQLLVDLEYLPEPRDAIRTRDLYDLAIGHVAHALDEYQRACNPRERAVDLGSKG